MNWLLLDLGNTALKWALVPAEAGAWPQAQDEQAAAAPEHGSVAIAADDLQQQLTSIFIHFGAGAEESARATAVFGCAVASRQTMQRVDAALAAAQMPATQWFAAAGNFDHDGIVLQNCYDDPAQLGADRWHALLGARAHFPREALVVIAAGTATTVDTLTANGRFLGGIIIPGMELMHSALARGTARLPLAAGHFVAHPTNTDDAIHTGTVDAHVGLIERRVRRARELAAGPVQVVLGGGNAGSLLPFLQAHGGFPGVHRAEDLVLRGLWHAARERAANAIAHGRKS